VAETVRVGDEPAQRRGVEPLAASRDEERVLGAARQLRARLVEVARNEGRGLLAERDDTVLRALPAADVHQLLLEVDVAEIEADRLGAAQAGRVDELDDRLVSQREGAVSVEVVDELFDLALLRRIRQPPWTLRRERRVGNVLRSEREAEQGANRRELPRDRRGREPPSGSRPSERSDPVGEDAHVHVLDGAVGPEPRRELAQVARVDATGPVADPGRAQEALGGGFERHGLGVRRRG